MTLGAPVRNAGIERLRARDALELAQALFPPDDARLATSLLTLSSLVLQTGGTEEAGRLAERRP